MSSVHGFFGKLPARGDFVSAGLPRSFVSRWDRWLAGVLPAALAECGDGWMQAPSWRFRPAAGVCGADAASGLLLASIDRVRRRFPLTLAWIGSRGDLDAAEAVARAAIADTMTPDMLASRLAGIPLEHGRALASGCLWWDGRGGSRLPLLPALPRYLQR